MPWYPNAERRAITTGEFGDRGPHKPLAIVDHITDGADSLDFLQNTANDSSVHVLISRHGKGVQFIDTDQAAWANGICNLRGTPPSTPDGGTPVPLRPLGGSDPLHRYCQMMSIRFIISLKSLDHCEYSVEGVCHD
jgi:hypothetical protein